MAFQRLHAVRWDDLQKPRLGNYVRWCTYSNNRVLQILFQNFVSNSSTLRWKLYFSLWSCKKLIFKSWGSQSAFQYGSCLERKMKETIILRFYVCRVVYIYKCNVLKSWKQFCLLKGAFCVSWKVRILKWLRTGINEPIEKKLRSHVFFLFWNYRPCDLLYKHKKHISFPPIVYSQGIPNSPYDVWSMQLALAAGEISYHFGR